MERLWTTRNDKERGIALLMVLWILLLLSLIAMSFLRDTRDNTNLARNSSENAKAQALADGGIRRAMLGLLDPEPSTAWRADGTVYQFTQGEGLALIRIEDDGGKVDLNRAPAPLLLGLFAAVGADSRAAQRLTDAILDFRDADHQRQVAGAEDADYLAAGLDAGAKDAPFDQKEELMQVLGMNRQVYDAVAPYVTVHSGRARINLLTASEIVLRAIPNLTPEQLEQVRESRVSGAQFGSFEGNVVTIHAEATTSGGGSFTREAVIKRSGDILSPFVVLEWRHAWGDATALGP